MSRSSAKPKRDKKGDRLGPFEGHEVLKLDGVRHRQCRHCSALFAPDDRAGLRLHIEAKHIPKPRRKVTGLEQLCLTAPPRPPAADGLWRRDTDKYGKTTAWICTTCSAAFGVTETEARRFHQATHTTVKRKASKPKKTASKKAG